MYTENETLSFNDLSIEIIVLTLVVCEGSFISEMKVFGQERETQRNVSCHFWI